MVALLDNCLFICGIIFFGPSFPFAFPLPFPFPFSFPFPFLVPFPFSLSFSLFLLGVNLILIFFCVIFWIFLFSSFGLFWLLFAIIW